jgi:hypothetical protein
MDDISRNLVEGLSEGQCPRCGNFYGLILVIDETTDPPTTDVPLCEMCWELRAAIPEEERPPIEVIEFRDNTRRDQDREALREEF